jgi:hypothetical protein
VGRYESNFAFVALRIASHRIFAMAIVLRGVRLCCTKIPICGGWCDTTTSPEVTHLRQFSNEKTVPRPCLWSGAARVYTESSAPMRKIGSIGFSCADKHRFPVMLTAFALSFAAWWMMFFAALALANNGATVQNFAWATADLTHPSNDVDAMVYVGIRNRVVTISPIAPYVLPANVSSSSVVAWRDSAACSAASISSACEECAATVNSMTQSVLLSLLTQVVQVATDLQRTTPFGDVNCQKLMGVVTGLVGLTSGLLSCRTFANSCWRAQPDTYTISSAPGLGALDASWSWGPGLLLMALGTALKAVDVLCHLVVPTPPKKREKGADNAKWTLPQYCAVGEAAQPTRLGYYLPVEQQSTCSGASAPNQPV